MVNNLGGFGQPGKTMPNLDSPNRPTTKTCRTVPSSPREVAP